VRAALESAGRLVALDPLHVSWRHLRARCRGNLALILEEQGRRGEALAAARESLEDFDRLVSRLPGDASLAAERENVAGRVRDLGAETAPPR